MKPDNLEKFVLKHRDDFDDLEPDGAMWNVIRLRIQPARKFLYKRIVWQAAAGIGIFLASWVIHDLVRDAEREVAVAELQEVGEQMEVLMEAEVFYTSRINTARSEVYRLSGNNNDMMEVLNADLAELEQVFEELKNDLRDEGDNQEVVEAMIQNYRLKLQILEEMLMQLKKSASPEEKTKGYEI